MWVLQIPGLPFVDKKLEEKRKKARAAQQKHREKNRKEKDTLIQVSNVKFTSCFE